MKELILPDYQNSIVNVACTIRKYFDLNYNHNTIEKIDKILEKNQPRNVVVILFDGMGSKLLKEKLPNDSFLSKHLNSEISSVVPSTTTASTTSMLSGLTPKEHGWLGWDLYFKEENKIVTMFTNTLKDTEIEAADYNVARKYFPYDTITDLINKEGKYYSKIIFPFGDDSYKDIDDMFIKIKNNLNKKDKNYIYAYYEDPDGIMHDTGTDSNDTLDCFKMINKKVEEFSSKLEDTLIIVVADHGHINCKEIILSDYKDIFDTLDGNTWIEGRMCAFKIKKGRKEEFKKLFNKYFKEDFILKTKEEVIKEQLFGDGIENKYFRGSLGDYFALAVSNKYFKYTKAGDYFKSAHAGFTIDEMKIPLIIIEK
ncbi:MAG: alkaline phosphatase family protein [Bacilli bacterium]